MTGCRARVPMGYKQIGTGGFVEGLVETSCMATDIRILNYLYQGHSPVVGSSFESTETPMRWDRPDSMNPKKPYIKVLKIMFSQTSEYAIRALTILARYPLDQFVLVGTLARAPDCRITTSARSSRTWSGCRLSNGQGEPRRLPAFARPRRNHPRRSRQRDREPQPDAALPDRAADAATSAPARCTSSGSPRPTVNGNAAHHVAGRPGAL